MKCRNLVHRSWGLNPHKMDWIHKAIIRPKLMYGSVVWANGLTKQAQNKLMKVQRLALTLITQPLRSTPTAALEVMMGWLPLQLYAQEMGMNTYLRNKNSIREKWDGIGKDTRIRGHLGLWRCREKEILSENLPREEKVDRYVWIEQHTKSTHSEMYPISIYTDASKNKSNVGLAWLLCIGDYVYQERWQAAKDIDIFQAELLAIKEALSWIKDNPEKGRDIQIFCDSLSVVTAINGYTANSALLLETMNLLQDLCANIAHVEIKWIKGHNNNTGNEAADILAKSGLREAEQLSYAEPYIPLSKKDIKGLIHDNYMNIWNDRWIQTSGYRISKCFYPKVRETKIMTKMSAEELSAITQMVTGHGLFKYHLSHWKELENDLCSLCSEQAEDSWHLWNDCPAMESCRQELRQLMTAGLPMELAIIRFTQNEKFKSLRVLNDSLIADIDESSGA